MLNLFSKTEQSVKKTRESWFKKVTDLFNHTRIDENIWEELEELLISADVGITTTAKLLNRVRQHAKENKLSEGSQVQAILKQEIIKLLQIDKVKPEIPDQRLQVILVIGVNGSGKTTSIAKLAYDYKQAGKQVILAAADTFRAAAIDQLGTWAARVEVQVVAHQPGGDPGAVVFDALQAAQNRKADIVMVDTAGRLHTKFNLMEELKKIKRIISKYEANQEVLLIMDATTGQNGLVQARHFTEAVGVNGIFLSKLDGTAKGGIVLAICDELKIPITYIGTGEHVEDIVPFNAETFVEALFAT